MLLPVVLAGGVGSRLWPVSRALAPKQFARFQGRANTFFQETVLRLGCVVGAENPLVICNEGYRFLVAEQLRELGLSQPGKGGASILLEPVSRNTAAAAALAAFHAISAKQDPVLLVLPSDHIISNSQTLLEAIEVGNKLAEEGHLVTFGVTPDSPETGYGYIERGEPLLQEGAWVVKKFTEKPDRQLAEQFIESNSHSWNSGMFMFRASVYLNQLNLLAPDIYMGCKHSYEAANLNPDFISIPLEPFSKCRAKSIDFAVMEKAKKAAVISLDAGWNDIGSWDAMWQLESKDGDGNSIEGDVFTSNVQGCLIHSKSRLIAAVGLSDVVIVETADAVLVASREQAQSVKELVSQMEFANKDEAHNHVKVDCPWGISELLCRRPDHQITHLFVSPRACVPSASQCHVAEQLFVVKGSVEISIGDKFYPIGAGGSAFIPADAGYSLVNKSDCATELLKVQLGVNICEQKST
jgi:mannose-1-phosphate guanylyltransferase/mannose-6-phosphate isomerase